MAREKEPRPKRQIESYEHRDKQRVNNPPVGLVTPETDPDAGQKKKTYAYDPHLDPQLVWAGKAEHTSFEVPTVSLHVHERIDPRTIIEAVRKRNGNGQPVQLPLFEEERREPLRQVVEFYRHAHGWSNRLIAGDSLLVMNSLLEKEGMAGKVQMIYIDPPYGIKYGSNFQPFVNKRDVKDGHDEDLTAEPEQIKAFRDTWELGIHSYLTYLRDRLLLARELLTESGSIFVQISDENVHHVRELMDEVFGPENFVAIITFQTAANQNTSYIQRLFDYLIWYGKEKPKIKYRALFRERNAAEVLKLFNHKRMNGSLYRPDDISTLSSNQKERIEKAGRIENSNGVLLEADFPYTSIHNVWLDTVFGHAKRIEKVYVVQTNRRVIQRCLLMTTDPGDLVFDPTCGSGTTAYVAEQWGRRWITCDTSRVAIAIARQRLMTAVFDYYELAQPEEGVGSGFQYKTVPHVTLKSIANNPEIDGIYERMHPAIEKALAALNAALKGKPIRFKVTQGGRAGHFVDFSAPDDQTFTMPSGQVVKVNELVEWEVPASFELFVDSFEWGPGATAAEKTSFEAELNTENSKLTTENSKLKTAFDAFHAARRAMQKAMDEAIARHADQETLYDQPLVDRKKVRVTGPFTVEAVPAPAVKSVDEILEPVSQPADASIARSGETLRQAEWRDELLKTGIRGKAGQYIHFSRLEPLPGCRWLHAEGETRPSDEGADSVRETGPAYSPMRVVVSFGPEHAPLEPRQVAQALEEAQTLVPRPKLIVFAAFQFDPEAAKDINETNWPGVTLLQVQMNADLLTDDLKKKRASNESFWLIGQPDVEVSSFEFLVLSGKDVRIGEYGTFKKLSGLDRLEEIHRLSWQDLFLYALLSQGRDVWAYLADQAGWDFHSREPRRRSGQKQQGGIPPVSWNSPGLVGGIGDIAGDLTEFGISDLDGCRRLIERLRGDQQIVGRLETLAQHLNFPIPPFTKNWQLKTKKFYRVSVHGFDYYNTKTGGVESGGADKIALWMLDTDYDGRSLYPRQVFFPMAGENEGWAKLARNLKAEIDEDLIEAYRGTVSLPFEAGEHRRIAVKIVDDRGIESLKVMEVE